MAESNGWNNFTKWINRLEPECQAEALRLKPSMANRLHSSEQDPLEGKRIRWGDFDCSEDDNDPWAAFGSWAPTMDLPDCGVMNTTWDVLQDPEEAWMQNKNLDELPKNHEEKKQVGGHENHSDCDARYCDVYSYGIVHRAELRDRFQFIDFAALAPSDPQLCRSSSSADPEVLDALCSESQAMRDIAKLLGPDAYAATTFAGGTAILGKTYKDHPKFFENLSPPTKVALTTELNPEHKASTEQMQGSIPCLGPCLAFLKTVLGTVLGTKQRRKGKKWHAFPSHSKKCVTAPYVVRGVKTYLEAKGYGVFFDLDNLKKISMPQLKAEIAQSHIFILFLDEDTLSSEWCQLEIAAAIEYGIPIHVVINIDHFNIPDLIAFWKAKQPNITKKLFGADSYQAIPYSVSHEVLHDSALAKIEQRILMAL